MALTVNRAADRERAMADQLVHDVLRGRHRRRRIGPRRVARRCVGKQLGFLGGVVLLRRRPVAPAHQGRAAGSAADRRPGEYPLGRGECTTSPSPATDERSCKGPGRRAEGHVRFPLKSAGSGRA